MPLPQPPPPRPQLCAALGRAEPRAWREGEGRAGGSVGRLLRDGREQDGAVCVGQRLLQTGARGEGSRSPQAGWVERAVTFWCWASPASLSQNRCLCSDESGAALPRFPPTRQRVPLRVGRGRQRDAPAQAVPVRLRSGVGWGKLLRRRAATLERRRCRDEDTDLQLGEPRSAWLRRGSRGTRACSCACVPPPLPDNETLPSFPSRSRANKASAIWCQDTLETGPSPGGRGHGRPPSPRQSLPRAPRGWGARHPLPLLPLQLLPCCPGCRAQLHG